MSAPLIQPLPLGQTLIEKGLISADQLRVALIEQQKHSHPLGRLLVALGFISEAVLREALSETLGRQSIDPVRALADSDALALIPHELARQYRLLPLRFRPATADGQPSLLTLAMADSSDIVAQDKIRAQAAARTGAPVALEILLAGDAEIDEAIDQHYGYELSIDGILREIETGATEAQAPRAAPEAYSHPVVRLIDALLTDAVKREASDIHFEPEAGFLRIRYRIDGMLRLVRTLHQSHWPALAVRIKVMSGMDIAESRTAQDGRISLAVNGRPIDFRVSALPTIRGENIVLRILDRQKGIVPLAGLGLPERERNELQRLVARPEGLILVTGPTGSGKTTTLYSLLGHIGDERINIMTLEDPVEYPMPWIRQTSVAEVKFGFADGVRAILRQDPDVILIGEIRDPETAEMAFRAAMTGHQVYATLHTNSALGAIPRLLDLEIPTDILVGNIIGIVAQRLLRRLCPQCRESSPPNEDESRLLRRLGQTALPDSLYRAGKGCEHCDFQGYRGRLAVMELLRIDSETDALLSRRAAPHEILQAARARGFRTLAENGMARVYEGATSLAELGRVVDLSGYHSNSNLK
ncbi:MAG: Flp pilus assembly complex ATPase component TadA [Betaproteobacteria bacterium]|nr:Flp pilus assembly complex ATPase component TadA [Betaproteobacteria bacterium]